MKVAAVNFAVAALMLSTGAHAKDWEWNYEMGRGGTSPASGTQRPTSGKNLAELTQQKDGSYEFRIRGNTAPPCYKSFKVAQVEESETTLMITPEPIFANCERIRLVVKKDGSGGIQQQLVGKKPNQVWQEEEAQGYDLTSK
ncbi:hypothetical protein [Variovorax sp.]|uniref:hypothetical protein n=1 Tax=Variovorax sp. TaxID=1871043 RepID=UPI0025ECA465|nr:hypothetical protein [Variovorax sp.]